MWPKNGNSLGGCPLTKVAYSAGLWTRNHSGNVRNVCSVPRQWTDVVAPDPEVVLGKGRAMLRMTDLLGLADLVSRLVEQQRRAHLRKGNDAAGVRSNVPPGEG